MLQLAGKGGWRESEGEAGYVHEVSSEHVWSGIDLAVLTCLFYFLV